MLGHDSLQMIHDRYYSHIKNYQRNDGSAFMEKVYGSVAEPSEVVLGQVKGSKSDPNENRGISRID